MPKADLKLVEPPKLATKEPSLLSLLRKERRLELLLIETRAQIAPLKRKYQEEKRCFGLSNERLLIELENRKG